MILTYWVNTNNEYNTPRSVIHPRDHSWHGTQYVLLCVLFHYLPSMPLLSYHPWPVQRIFHFIPYETRFSFSLQFLSETILFLRTQRDTVAYVPTSSVKYQTFVYLNQP